MVQGNEESDSRPDQGSVDPLGVIGWELAGKYKITGYLGGGGFGEVYQGHNVDLTEQRIVVKFLKRHRVLAS